MAWYSDWDRFPRTKTVAERRRDAGRAVAQLEKKGRALQPVTLEGRRTIAATFWGQAWCEHLETYSDYSNRLPRGRSYVRNGSVIDLRVEPGVVHALVSGSRVYTVKIDVTPLGKARWKELVAECSGQIDSVIALLQGQLPDAALARLCDRSTGLFPSSKQLAMTCSCPDWAGLCKHLAAVLYGVGARLDREPELLFVLRGVDKLDLVGAAAGGALLERPTGEDALTADALGDIFGIELEAERPAPPKALRSRTRRTARGQRPAAVGKKSAAAPPVGRASAPPASRTPRRASSSTGLRAGSEFDTYNRALEKLGRALQKATRPARRR